MIGYYIAIFFILFAFEFAYCQLARKLRIVDRPHHQSSHKGNVIRGGGIVFFIAFLLWSVLNEWHAVVALSGLAVIALVSFIDDIHSIAPKIRLVCQFLAIGFMYHSGFVNYPSHVIIIMTIACVGLVNIFNFMDGINGMTGGYSLVVLMSLLYVNTYVVHFTRTDLMICIILSLIVFDLFNFRKKALCFAGDVGALAIGFIVMYFVLRLVLAGKSMSWVSMIIVYAVDGGLTILHRILLKENLMKPHKKHAYQIMANELKMSHLVVSGIYMGLQAGCSAWYIVNPGYQTLFLQAVFLTAVYLLFMKNYYHLHVKNN